MIELIFLFQTYRNITNEFEIVELLTTLQGTCLALKSNIKVCGFHLSGLSSICALCNVHNIKITTRR